MNRADPFPMFPLGTVLMPGALVPLRLFEPRYLQLYEDLGDGGEFGVTLIERGHEVGGNDARFDVGCAARIVASSSLDDGSVFIVAAGTERLRVIEWLEDAPYPVARVETVADDPATEHTPFLVEGCLGGFRAVRALLSELGADVGDEPELSPDPALATYQIAHLTPLQELDKLRLLETTDPDDRASLLQEYLADLQGLLTLELGS